MTKGSPKWIVIFNRYTN